ncbi:DUF4190 domain-containing protein [Streptomyces marokkonensis]|uniref:DUF4190 domain-containing protein n=1 Tax=Streptomyces marokkonensis TaxID=324855 RepID=A0ABP7NWB8_9ACTN
MTDAAQPGEGSAGGHDPWAPPEDGPSSAKGRAAAQQPWEPVRPPADAGPFGQRQPPSVHDQVTVTGVPTGGMSMPPAGHAAPADRVPPPPVAPGGPGLPGGPGVLGAPGGPFRPGVPGAPGGYGYPGYPQGYGWPGLPLPPQNGMGTAAMVLGILACSLFCMYGVVSLVLGTLAVVFGVKGRRRAARGEANNHGQAQAGFVMGIIGIVLGIAVTALIAAAIIVSVNDDSEYDDPYYGTSESVSVSVVH